MKTPIRKTERILNLLAYLMKSRRVVPFEEIRANIDGYNDDGTNGKTVARRFERDKEAFEALGVKLVYTCDAKGVWGYAINTADTHVSSGSLSSGEISLLAALSSAGGNAPDPLRADLASACQKLLARHPLPEDYNGRAKAPQAHMSLTLDPLMAANLQFLATVSYTHLTLPTKRIV